ncbi:MAG: type IV pilus assembly protein PilM [Candidatus Pacebacteria bacterium]|nr:type IV pilus assembly protein PilM [Candidatus Paceibacterota bacterium]MBP9715894.1 type IV pilus assembly protein PilM [Candidatus Paceibacterota bacterium]
MGNSFGDIIKNGLQSLFGKESNKSALGVDIGSSSIKLVQIKKQGGKAVLETYGALALGPYMQTDVGQVVNAPVDVIAQALTDLMKEANVTTNFGVVAIPSLSSFMSVISLPSSVDKDKFAEIIPNEARKYIPIPMSEVTLDWWPIPRQVESYEENEGGVRPEVKNEVLLVAIHNDTLTKYKDVLTKVGLTADFFELEIFSSVRSTFSHDIAPVLFIDFGASKTKLSIVEYGIIRVFHIVNRGGADITKNISQSLSIPFKDAEQLKREVGIDRNANKDVAEVVSLSVEYMLSDANNIVLAFEKKYNKNISKVILSGGGALTKGLLARATENFRAEVVYGAPFSKTEAPAFLTPVLEVSGPEFAAAVGISLRQLS